MKIIAKINFTVNGNKYIKGDEIKLNDINAIIKLNEAGFIEPLSYEDIVRIEREINKKKEEL
jgi:hypothetical protein